VQPLVSVAVTEKLTVLVVVGVPDSLPEVESVKPVGNVPLVNVYGVAALPLAMMMLLVTL
jgi:hypothetical protein